MRSDVIVAMIEQRGLYSRGRRVADIVLFWRKRIPALVLPALR